MTNWKEFRIGDKASFHWNDFEGVGVVHGKISEVDNGHAIMTYDGVNYWIDDSTAHMFREGWR